MLAGIQRCYGGVRFPMDRPSPRNVLRLDMGAIPLIHKMHQSGIFLDTTALSTLDARITEEMASTLENLQLLSDRNLNPNSGDQVARILYDELNLHKKLAEERVNTRVLKYEKAGWDLSKVNLEMKDVIRMTSSGSRLSTDDEALSQLQHLDPLVPLILDYRGLSKLKNTYTKATALPRYLNPHTGRIHTHFNVCRAATGRLASSEPNLQNIPTRGRPGWVTNWGNEIRKCFKAMYPDTVLASMDLSQIEMVWAAYVSRDPRMMKVFLDNEDLHTMTALAMFRLNPYDVQPDPEKKPGATHPSGVWPITWKEFKTKYRLPAKCFHPDTEVLTRTGWKKIMSLSLGEEIIQAVPRPSGECDLQWVVPLEVYSTCHQDQKLIHLKNTGMDLRVTPDHRMLGFTPKGKHKVVRADEFSQCGALRYWLGAGTVQDETPLVVDEVALRLAVALQADGSITPHNSIKFGFSKRRKIRRLRGLLRAYDIPFSEAIHNNGSNGKVTAFSIKQAHCQGILSLLDSDKTLPWWWLGLSQKLREVVLDEVRYWDSCQVDARAVYSSIHQKNVDVLQAIASITGVKSRATKGRSTENLSLKKGSRYRTENLSSSEIPFTEEVACLSVPSTFVLVRDGGVPVICGQTLGFGILYGVTPRGLQQQILSAGGPFWTEEECEEAIKLWYAVYQGVYEWTCWQHSRARRYGCVWDHFGRWREVPEVRSTIESVISAGLRQAGNMPIQSGAQGVIKLAMAEVVPLVEYYQSLGERCIPLLQIHDELLFELSRNIAEEFCAQVREIMQNAVALPIPIGSSRDIAATWGDLK